MGWAPPQESQEMVLGVETPPRGRPSTREHKIAPQPPGLILLIKSIYMYNKILITQILC